MNNPRYDHRQCASLFGYAAHVHERSGGVCQLCGFGAGWPPNFDQWRQLTVEHLIGRSQGGYRDQINVAVIERFPELSDSERSQLVEQIDALNTVSACSFCNSATSRHHHSRDMNSLINAASTPEAARAVVQAECEALLQTKRAQIQWKLQALREAFEAEIKPELAAVRRPAAQ